MASLPPIPADTDPRLAATVNALVREYNRNDRKAPIVGATDTGSSTAYAVNYTPGIVQYEVGQEFAFLAANTNTVANPTLSINGLPTGTLGTGIGTINGGAMVRVLVVAVSGGNPTFQLLSPQPSFAASLGADVALNNIANYFDGPSVAQGTSGTWYASGTVTCVDTAGLAGFPAKLWDGTTVIASTVGVSPTANAQVSIALSGRILNPAGNIRISVRDNSSVSGKIQFNQSGNSKDSTLTAVRVG